MNDHDENQDEATPVDGATPTPPPAEASKAELRDELNSIRALGENRSGSE